MANEDLVYHYTKREVLPKIFLPEGKIKLQFTKINSSKNDQSEGLVFRNFFEKYREEIASSLSKDLPKDLLEVILKEPITEKMMNLSNTYIFCTSRLMDSSVFWDKEYANTKGISIEFDEHEIFENIRLNGGDLIIRDVEYINLCDYEEENIKAIAGTIHSNFAIPESFGIRNSPEEILSTIVDYLSCIYKQKSWEHEIEVRIVATDTNVNPNNKYIDKFFDKATVSTVMLGPECSYEQVKEVEEYLNKNGYNDIAVERSRAFELRNQNPENP